MFQKLIEILTAMVIRKPIVVLVLIFSLVGICSTYISDLHIDASPDSLMLESDPDLKYYREIRRDYASDQFIIVGFRPNKNMLDRENIQIIENISNQFKNIEGIAGVTALSNVPLLLQLKDDEETGQTSFSNLIAPDVDIEKARQEFLSSPIYLDNLISKDLKTTAIKVDFEKNKKLASLNEKKYVLLNQLEAGKSKKIATELDELRTTIREERQVIGQRYKEILGSLRSIIFGRCSINGQ